MPTRVNPQNSSEPAGQNASIRAAASPADAAFRLDPDAFKFMFEHSILAKSFTLPSGEMNVNQAFCDMLGYTWAELKARNWQGITHPADLAVSLAANQALLSGEKDSVRIVKRYLHKNGSVVWADVSACIRRDESGQPLYIMSDATDITDRQQAEQALQASENMTRTLFDTMTEGVALNQAVYDDQGRIVDYRILEVNKAFYQVADFAPGQVIGKLASQLYGMTPETIQAFWKDQKTATDTVHSEFISPLNKRTFYVSTSPLQNDTFVTSFVDITELKQAEQQRRSAEERFNGVFRSSPIGIHIFRLADGCSLDANAAYLDLIGYTRAELLGHTSEELNLFVEPAQRKVWLQALHNNGSEKAVETAIRTKSGQVRHAFFSIETFEMNGEQVGMVLSVDISDRKQAETALLQKVAELERFQRLTVGRELKMIELKKEINALLAQSGLPPRYPVPGEEG